MIAYIRRTLQYRNGSLNPYNTTFDFCFLPVGSRFSVDEDNEVNYHPEDAFQKEITLSDPLTFLELNREIQDQLFEGIDPAIFIHMPTQENQETYKLVYGSSFLHCLREANKQRNAEWTDKPVSLAFRGLELVTEAGEAGEVIKKYSRTLEGISGGIEKPALLSGLRDELADTLIAIDLICMDLGLDIEEITKAKFNKTSEKMAMETRL